MALLLDQESELYKGPDRNILGFAATQLCHCSAEIVIDDM